MLFNAITPASFAVVVKSQFVFGVMAHVSILVPSP
jgi:hypothetical protein